MDKYILKFESKSDPTMFLCRNGDGTYAVHKVANDLDFLVMETVDFKYAADAFATEVYKTIVKERANADFR